MPKMGGSRRELQRLGREEVRVVLGERRNRLDDKENRDRAQDQQDDDCGGKGDAPEGLDTSSPSGRPCRSRASADCGRALGHEIAVMLASALAARSLGSGENPRPSAAACPVVTA